MSRRVPSAKGAKPPAGTRGTPRPDLRPLRQYDLAKMAKTEPPEPDFVIQHLAARGEVSQLWGAPGIGKSMLVEACCGGVGHGTAVAGLQCQQGRVLYLDAENGAYEVHRRVRNLDLPPARVAIYDAGAAHLVRDSDAVEAAIEYEQPDLLVLDSLRRLTAGTDENDSGAMAEVVGLIKHWASEFDVAALLIHHARKDGTTERGSSAIKDQVSVSWQMRREPAAFDRTLRVLECHKMRIAAEPPDLWLSIVWNGGVRILGAAAADTTPIVTGPQRNVLADSIVKLLEDKQGSRAAIAKKLGRTPKDGTMRRALAELEEAGVITKNDDGKYELSPPVPLPGLAPLATGTPSNGASGDSVAPQVAPKARGAAS